MSVLKSIGEDILKGLKIVGQFVPIARILAGATPTKVDDAILNVFDGIINTTRIIEVAIPAVNSAASGADKAAAALPIVKQILLSSELVKGSEIVNEDEFIASAKDFINAAVRLQNSLRIK